MVGDHDLIGQAAAGRGGGGIGGFGDGQIGFFIDLGGVASLLAGLLSGLQAETRAELVMSVIWSPSTVTTTVMVAEHRRPGRRGHSRCRRCTGPGWARR